MSFAGGGSTFIVICTVIPIASIAFLVIGVTTFVKHKKKKNRETEEKKQRQAAEAHRREAAEARREVIAAAEFQREAVKVQQEAIQSLLHELPLVKTGLERQEKDIREIRMFVMNHAFGGKRVDGDHIMPNNRLRVLESIEGSAAGSSRRSVGLEQPQQQQQIEQVEQDQSGAYLSATQSPSSSLIHQGAINPVRTFGYDGACDDDSDDEKEKEKDAGPVLTEEQEATREYNKVLGAAKLARIESQPSPQRAFPTDPGSSAEPSPNEHPDGHIADKAAAAKILAAKAIASNKPGYFDHRPLAIPKGAVTPQDPRTPAGEVAMFHMDGGDSGPDLNPHRGAIPPNPTSVGYHDPNETQENKAEEEEDEAVREARRPPPGSGRVGFLRWEKYQDLPTP